MNFYFEFWLLNFKKFELLIWILYFESSVLILDFEL